MSEIGRREESEGKWEGYEAWKTLVEEDHRGGFKMQEGQIRRLIKGMEELKNERRREEDWRMAQVGWLSEMDKGMWLGGDGRYDRERPKGGERKKRREWQV